MLSYICKYQYICLILYHVDINIYVYLYLVYLYDPRCFRIFIFQSLVTEGSLLSLGDLLSVLLHWSFCLHRRRLSTLFLTSFN